MEKQNKHQVIISKQARQMLVSHAAFLARVSPTAAEQLVVAFEEAANSLAALPQRCPWFAGEYIPKHTYRFLIFEKRYLLIFQIQNESVYVDYVVDCREDYSWLNRF